MDRFQVASTTLATELGRPYTYGQSDCFFTAMRVIDALQGADRTKIYLGKYKSLKGAAISLRKRGFKSLDGFFADFLQPIAPAMASIGDIGIVSLPVGTRFAQHVAVHNGRDFVIKTADGAVSYVYSDPVVTHAFRV